MAKQKRTQKTSEVRSNNGSGRQFEHTEVFDDHLLPDALEIQKLHEMDPAILQWLKDRAEKEQDFRHNVFETKAKMINDSEKGVRNINYMGMTFAFIFLCLGLVFSSLLIYQDKIIAGTIFSGATLLIGASMLIGRKIRSRNNDN